MVPEEFLLLANLHVQPMFLLSGDGRITACNASGGAWLGSSPDEVAGCPITEFLVDTPEAITQCLNDRHDSLPARLVELAWRRNGIPQDQQRCTLRPLPANAAPAPQAFLLVVEAEAHNHEGNQNHSVSHTSATPSAIRRVTREPTKSVSAGYLEAIINSSLDAIIGRDLDGRIVYWNTGAERLFGYTAAEMLGKSLEPLIPRERQHEHQQILDTVSRGETVTQFETVRQAKDGRPIEVSVTASPIKDGQGQIIGTSTISRDITVLKEHQREIERITRLYAALREINQAIAWLPERDELFQTICRVLVELGGLSMAWIGWIDPDTWRSNPVAHFGDKHGYLNSVNIYVDDRPEGQGPSGIAFRTGKPYLCSDVSQDPATLAWRSEFQRCGFQSCAAFPIRVDGAVQCLLAVYADQVNFFHDKEVALLEEAALEVSFALDNLARETARRRADIAESQEREFSNALLKSLPGVLYLYDKNGRFLRWNKHLEEVCGYGAEEIAVMSPMDFFAGDDKATIEATIQDVFQRGMSSVEAGLVSKDGRSTPYYFTGVTTRFNDHDCLIGIGIDISERKQAELLRRQSDERYRALFDHAPDGIVIFDRDGHYLDVNPSACRMLGYPRNEFVQLHVSQVIAPDDLHRIQPAIDTILNRGTNSGDWGLRRKDGSIFRAETISTLLPDGNVLAMIRDVTERVRDQEQLRDHAAKLRESEAHLLQAQRIAKLGSWELTISDGSLHWSDQIYDIFEINKIQFANSFESFVERVHPEDRDDLLRAQHAAVTGHARLDFEHRIITPDGREKVVMEQADLKLDDAGQPWKLSGIVLDITDRKRMELERERRHRAEAADRVKSAFLATMSHELRTPLNSIIGFTGIILQGLAGPLTSEQQKQLGMVRGSARHLLSLVNDVLDISKIESGQLVIAHDPFNPRKSIEKVAGLVAPLAESKQLDFALDVAPVLNYAVGDERRFEQILWNLLSNAIKFTERGRVTLSAGIVSDASPFGSPLLSASVSDTGVGIKTEDLATLFQPFRQLDSGLARRHEGTGLGLAISRRLAEMMGGEIRAESVWGQGSAFHVTLPLERTVSG